MNHETILFIIGSAVIFLLFLLLLFIRKKISLLSVVSVLLSCIPFVFMRNIKPIQRNVNLKNTLLLVNIALMMVTILLHYVFLFVSIYKNKKVKETLGAAHAKTNESVYGILNAKGDIIYITEHFKKLFKNEGNWYKQVSKFELNYQEMKLSELKNKIKELKSECYLDIYPFSQPKISLHLVKNPFFNENKLSGYLLETDGAEKKQGSKENESTTIWFEMLNEPLMYYDHYSLRYILTKPMAKLLKAEKTITEQQFSTLILSDDLAVHSKKNSNEKKIYRLKTINGIEWFEEIVQVIDNIEYVIIKRAEIGNFKYKTLTKTNLIEDLKIQLHNPQPFSLVIISINSILKYHQMDSELAEILLSKYFYKLNEGTLKGRYRIYKLGNIEYAFIFNNQEEYEVLLRNLKNNMSDFLASFVHVNEVKYKIENAVGLVSNNQLQEQTPEACIKAGLEALYLATDSNYKNNYSIYLRNSHHVDFEFKDVKIELEDTFLEDL